MPLFLLPEKKKRNFPSSEHSFPYQESWPFKTIYITVTDSDKLQQTFYSWKNQTFSFDQMYFRGTAGTLKEGTNSISDSTQKADHVILLLGERREEKRHRKTLEQSTECRVLHAGLEPAKHIR